MMDLKIAETTSRSWKVNEQRPLNSQYRWGDRGNVISFIYCPETREFNLGIAKRHKELVQEFKTPLAKFVRGIYIREKKKVVLRAYSCDDIENFNAQYDTVEALNLEAYKVKFNASKDELYYQYDWQ